ncbi:hypothetical protein H7J87_12060 [Mycolicibacterium wolinskyi]|uniref:hypothetical protein n=1 Tax=Mycolicibacterium TaxID=1866885 RepID=UPI00105528F7|nr:MULTISPECIES: hypothetical protein [Mycolicibacterium]MCV7286066.1 hypothetical protein [Mycolicibacterium wolinskyi]MCV7296262.1 hypothetical protein [Mycolicibacterium goodii]
MGTMLSGPAILKLDAVMCLCAACGTAMPADHERTETDPTGLGCKHCGSLMQGLNGPEEIAHLVAASDPRQLRAERLRIIKDSAAIKQVRLRSRGLNPDQKNELAESQDALRAAFLASIGAVPVPLTFYAVWLDAWEREAGRKAQESEQPFRESVLNDYGHEAAHSRRRRFWLATIPFRRDEMLPLYGASQVSLFLPPAASAEFLQHQDERSAPLLGHSSVQGLVGRSRNLHAWALGDKLFPPTAYTDVDELRSKRLRMRTLRRAWARPLLAAAKHQIS